jgi:hypothetical protein
VGSRQKGKSKVQGLKSKVKNLLLTLDFGL